MCTFRSNQQQLFLETPENAGSPRPKSSRNPRTILLPFPFEMRRARRVSETIGCRLGASAVEPATPPILRGFFLIVPLGRFFLTRERLFLPERGAKIGGPERHGSLNGEDGPVFGRSPSELPRFTCYVEESASHFSPPLPLFLCVSGAVPL
jgi:hypothetical protein